MALPIKPTQTVTGDQAKKHLELIKSGKSTPKDTLDLTTPPKTLEAVQNYLSKKKAQK